MKLTHVRLLVRDFPAEFRFWRDAVGLRPTYGGEEGGYAHFDTGDATLAILRTRWRQAVDATARGQRGNDQAALILRVEDVEASYRQLRDRGVVFVSTPHDRSEWGVRVAHFRDPEGNLVEIYRPL